MATLALTLSEIKSAVGHFIGVGRDSANWDTATSDDVDRFIREGKREFYFPPPIARGAPAHKWNFLEQYDTTITNAIFDDGTVEVASGVVTLTGGTWPAAAQSENSFLNVDGTLYEVSTRDSGTQLTLLNTSFTVAAGTSYELIQFRYPLPSDFGGLITPITFAQQQNFTEPELIDTVEAELRVRYSRNFQTGVPTHYATVPKVETNSEGSAGTTNWFFMLWPLPDTNYELKALYRIIPTDGLEAADSALDNADPMYADCMLAAILAAAERQVTDREGPQHDAFMRKLEACISHDRRNKGTRHVRHPRRPTELIDKHKLTAPITYSVTP